MLHNIVSVWSWQGNSPKKLENVPYLKEHANVFTCHSAVSGVVTTGEKALVSLFVSKPGIGLNLLRYQAYFENLATKPSHIELQDLPPTAAAAGYLQAGKAVLDRRCRHGNTELVLEIH